MALDQVQHITWSDVDDSLPDALTSDLIITFPTEAPETHIPALIKALASWDDVSFSVVILTDTDRLHLFPEHLSSVPTLQEAYDIIELERIERDLGF